MNKYLYFPILISAMGFAHSLYAESPKGSIRLEAGTEYDSNLSVVELDQYSAQSDWAALLNARLNGHWKPSDKLDFKAGYSYLTKTYQDNESFDLAIKQMFADASYNFDVFTLGASYHNADAELAKRDYLQLQQTSLSVSRLFNNCIFVRAAANYQDKDFPGNAERNSHNTGVAGDVFVFFQQGNTFVAAGFTREEEDAAQNQFNYDALSLRASINHKLSVWGKASKLQLGMRYHDRDYSAVIPDTDNERNSSRSDSHRVANIEWEMYLTPKITATSKIERGNYESNFAAADYSETLASVTFAVTF